MLMSALAVLVMAAHPPKIVAPGEGEPVGVPFHPVDLILSEDENADGLTVYEFRVPPRSAGAPPHIHTHEDELFFVVSGDLTLLNGDETVVAGPGTIAALTRNNLHGFWNAGDEEVVMWVVATPGNFEDFFDEVARRIRDEAPAGPAEAGALVAQAGAERGITIRMDKLPAEAAPLYGLPPQE
jgi:mannose-6-phosphate isomerase-like protein (cupin superfamily)